MSSDFDTCKRSSAQLCARLRAQGIDARWIQLADFIGTAPDADPRWASMPPVVWTHYVVVANNEVIDIAPRQFWPDSEVPLVTTQASLPESWEARHDITDALNEFLSVSREAP